MDTTSVQSLTATPITSPPLINQSSAIFKPHGDLLSIQLHHKKCIHHRAVNCGGRIDGSNAGSPYQLCMQHQANTRLIRINGNVVQRTTGSSSVQPCPSSGSVTSVVSASAIANAVAAVPTSTSPSSSSSSSSTSGSSSSNGPVAIQSQAGLVQLMSATLLADRYLLMDMVDGSTLYKCVDLKSHEELVCKVSVFFCFANYFSLYSDEISNYWNFEVGLWKYCMYSYLVLGMRKEALCPKMYVYF